MIATLCVKYMESLSRAVAKPDKKSPKRDDFLLYIFAYLVNQGK